MKRKSVFLVCLFFISILPFNMLYAQEEKEPPQKNYWIASEVTIKTKKHDDFKKFAKELVNIMKEQKFQYNVHVFWSHNLTYTFFCQLESENDLKSFFDDFDKLYEHMDQEIFEKGVDGYLKSKLFTFRHIPELSYAPESPRLQDGEYNFMLSDKLYVKTSSIKRFKELVAELKKLLKEKGYDDYLNVYKPEIGMEKPMFFGVLWGKNTVDLYEQNKRMWELLGEEGEKIYDEMFSLLRDREMHHYHKINKLTYIKEKE